MHHQLGWEQLPAPTNSDLGNLDGLDRVTDRSAGVPQYQDGGGTSPVPPNALPVPHEQIPIVGVKASHDRSRTFRRLVVATMNTYIYILNLGRSDFSVPWIVRSLSFLAFDTSKLFHSGGSLSHSIYRLRLRNKLQRNLFDFWLSVSLEHMITTRASIPLSSVSGSATRVTFSRAYVHHYNCDLA